MLEAQGNAQLAVTMAAPKAMPPNLADCKVGAGRGRRGRGAMGTPPGPVASPPPRLSMHRQLPCYWMATLPAQLQLSVCPHSWLNLHTDCCCTLTAAALPCPACRVWSLQDRFLVEALAVGPEVAAATSELFKANAKDVRQVGQWDRH